MTGWHTNQKDLKDQIEDLKRRLPAAYVVEDCSGVSLEAAPDGRLVGLCPFHDDTDPSFAVYWDADRAGWRTGCWSCDYGPGDVVDYIARWKEVDIVGAVGWGWRLLESFDPENWVEPETAPEGPPPDLLGTARAAFAGYRVGGAVDELVERKGLAFDGAWLRGNWWVGELDGHVYAPHFGEGVSDLSGMKRRKPDDQWYAIKGSKLKWLYGTWRDKGRTDVVLCEGETDTWTVSWVLGDVDVLGLPAGADTIRDEWVDRMRDRRVVVLFDGDDAGRKAAQKWVKRLDGVAAETRVADLPTGSDASSLDVADLTRILSTAEEVRVSLSDGYLTEVPGVGYARARSGDLVCDWTFSAVKEIRFEDGTYGYEAGDGRVITASDARSSAAVKAWGARYGHHWFGNDKDAQYIFRRIREGGAGLEKGIGAWQVGWYDGAFITVAETLGPRSVDYVYVPGEVSAVLKRIVTFDRPAVAVRDRAEFARGLLSLHQPDVIHPLVGWTAASVMRPLFREFPTLAVMGASGTGKTTLIDTVLGAFGFGGGEQNLTSTTRYGLSMLVSGSRGVPIWIDEYRPGASRDALIGMEQIIRDAWTSATSLRGGVGNDWSAVSAKAATAPLVVSGEDAFDETSLRERSVLLDLPLDYTHRSASSLRAVRSGGQWGRDWIEWLQGAEWGVAAVDGLSRPEVGVAVVRWGWDMLARWLSPVMDIGEPDLSRVEWWVEGDEDRAWVVDGRRAASRDPWHDLVLWGAGRSDRDGGPLVWVEGGRTMVRTMELVRAAKDYDWRLAGGSKAFNNYLVERFGQSYWSISEKTEYGRATVLGDTVEGLESDI